MRFALIFLLLCGLCACSSPNASTPQTASSGTPGSSPSSQPSARPELGNSTDPAAWLGEWEKGQYDCGGVGEKLNDDGLRIEKGEGNKYRVTLFTRTALPPVVEAAFNTQGELAFKDQDINGGTGSGVLILKAERLQLKISSLAGLIQCNGTDYQKK